MLNGTKTPPARPDPIQLEAVKTGRSLDRAIAVILLVTACIQPLIKYENEFIWLKIFFNQVILTVTTILFLLKLKYLRKIEIPRARTLLPAAAMVIVGFLSIIQADNWYRSFDYSLRIGANLLYYFFFLMHIRTRRHFRGFFWAVLIASFYVAMYGILQFYEFLPVPYDIYQEKDPSSSIGLTNFCSEYLITVLPLIVFGFFLEDFSGFTPVVAVLFLPIYFYFLITKARAAWLGFILSGILSLILIFMRWRREEGSFLKNSRYLSLLAGALAFIVVSYALVFSIGHDRELNMLLIRVRVWIGPFLIGLGMIGALFYAARRQALSRPFYLLMSLVVIGIFVLSFSSYGKLKQFRSIFASLSEDPAGISVDQGTLPIRSGDPSIDFRFQAWMSTFKTFWHNPILGVGLGNLETAIHPYQVPKLQNTISRTYQVFSEAHNDYLHILSEVGILGFGAFIWFLIALARTSMRLLRKDLDTGRFLILLGTQAGLVGTLVAAIFSFPLQEPASSMNFWFLAAFLEIHGLGFLEEKIKRPVRKDEIVDEAPREFVYPLFQGSPWGGLQTAAYYLLLLASFAGCIVLPWYTFRYAMAENYVKEGIALRNQRMWGRAEDDFTQAVKRNPDNYIYYFHRAIVRYNQGNLAGTEEDLRNCLRLSPKFGLAYRILGGVYLGMGKIPQAEDSLKMAVLYLPPISREVGAHLAQAAIELRRPDDAIEACETALRFDPNRPDLLTLLGKGYYMKGSLQKAKEAFQKAVALNPRMFDAQLNLGLASLQMKDLETGKAALEAAQGLNPTSATLWFGLAMTHSLEGQRGEALTALKKAISLDPKFTDAARVDPAFEPLRSDRSFQALVTPKAVRK